MLTVSYLRPLSHPHSSPDQMIGSSDYLILSDAVRSTEYRRVLRSLGWRSSVPGSGFLFQNEVGESGKFKDVKKCKKKLTHSGEIVNGKNFKRKGRGKKKRKVPYPVTQSRTGDFSVDFPITAERDNQLHHHRISLATFLFVTRLQRYISVERIKN